MVRKRTRASRKNYSSDDNYTDSDYELDEEHTEPAPKKYSLRQRKKTVFIEDYDYEDAEDDIPSRLESDDEDFEVERELDLSPEIEIEVKETDIEPKPDEDGLIDFEDVIRADIVVNKNRIDYEHFISTNEIKPRQQISPKSKNNKRGRKPKNQETEENDHNVLEPETEIMESSTEIINTNENLPLECIQTELKEDSDEKLANVEENRLQAQPDSTVNERQENTSVKHQESVIKVNPALQLNGNNSEAPNVDLECKEEIEEEDDDDVILIEDKKEVIILDDD